MKKLLLLFALLLINQNFQGQTIQEQADEKLNALMQAQSIPGLSISISQKGELVFSKGYGYADLATKTAVDPSLTKFRIGSVSKTVTAAGLGLLYQRGIIDLDAPVTQYVPIWPKKSHPITIRQLAGHLGGIRHYEGNEFYNTKNYPTVTDGLSIFMNDPLINVPGSEYSYSSYGWNLISVAMEKANGGGTFLQASDFLQFMQQEVFDALKMENTVAQHVNTVIPNLTKFYERDGDKIVSAPFVDNSYKWAGGGFVGTTEDLCRFGQAHMKTDFLLESTLDNLMISQTTDDGKKTNYGVGWRTFERPSGKTFYGHSGGSVGGITYFLIHKPSETVLAITGNISPLNYNGIQFDLMELFIDNKN